MAVVAMWKCDRDDSMFDNKKDADAYDKMLELAESFTQFLEKHAEGISEKDAETIGLLLAHNKEQVITACKGKPEVLLSLGEGEGESNITELSAAS
ncbi:YebG family protein [Dasania marina]|uniref:YebG family protein n=1 Tax=Dasania marina TaxID=471499 RepID=UPI00035F41F9|nr:YebG family protein [Dasania marina]|tara:strand:- start:71823 stop:72110 length:288 start_codon:yes stop_codon:yes gene_type:complete